MIVPISDLSQHGLVKDRPPHELPLNAWSDARNIRFRGGFAEKFLGHTAVFGAASVAPYFLLPASSLTTFWWVYAGLEKVYVTQGGFHTNITRQTATVDVNYTGTALDRWTGAVLNGLVVLNNGKDSPQKWPSISASAQLESLDYVTGTSTWESVGYRAGAMRSYKNFLVAVDITKGATRYPHLVKWSHPAAPGLIPSTWDETDTTSDAGEYPLSQTNGFVLDCVQLRDTNIIYKEDTIHGMQFIGGLGIFRFYPIFNQIGMMARNCALEFFSGKHAVFGNGDCVVHDGQNMHSILSDKMRRTLFARIDSSKKGLCFIVYNQKFKEIWFCYCSQGAALPDEALIWNTENGALSFRELPGTAHINSGLVDTSAVSDLWDADTTSWDSKVTSWDDVGFTLAEPDMLIAGTTNSTLLKADSSAQFSSANMTVMLERTGLGIPPRQDGALPDITRWKFLRALYPRIEGTIDAKVSVQVGTQDFISGPITWQPKMDYKIGSTRRLDMRVKGRMFAVKFESQGNFNWRLHGYDLDADFLGLV